MQAYQQGKPFFARFDVGWLEAAKGYYSYGIVSLPGRETYFVQYNYIHCGAVRYIKPHSMGNRVIVDAGRISARSTNDQLNH
ncbi:MAG: hypothetical protein EON58_14385 [Alphaproteobacteria bacterium]|nr:MAG: hypothetical protein EON58_14385 [Alphaproteobacteria bacterium]